MHAGRMITASISVSLTHTWDSLAPSSIRGLIGRDARNAASRPRYSELMIKKNAITSVPPVLSTTARMTSRLRMSLLPGACANCVRKSRALVSTIYRITPR